MVKIDSASFRDPCGFVFSRGQKILRQINPEGQADYTKLMESGLYENLVSKGWLVAHRESDEGLATEDGWLVIEPERIPFISYPYEWCFKQLQDAALLTLDLMTEALEVGLILKDASAYNIQFVGAKPVFIDTLSFQVYEPGQAWPGYRQFCQHFLAPLALASYLEQDLHKLLRIYIDGVPLPVASRLLPRTTWLRPGLATHIHAHGRSIQAYEGTSNLTSRPVAKLSQMGLLGIVDSLRSNIAKMSPAQGKSAWSDYEETRNYSGDDTDVKHQVVRDCLSRIQPNSVWDLGANQCEFSLLAAKSAGSVVAWEGDSQCVQRAYEKLNKSNNTAITPLVADLLNPSPSLGFGNDERKSMVDRGPADLVLVLALVHHLHITGGVSYERIAWFLARCAKNILVEFIPYSDPQVQRLLSSQTRSLEYDEATFTNAFEAHFDWTHRHEVGDTGRILYEGCRRG